MYALSVKMFQPHRRQFTSAISDLLTGKVTILSARVNWAFAGTV
jgi:hypothetical protein